MTLADLSALLEPYGGDHPGIAIGAVHNGRVVARAANGFADLEHKTPMTCGSHAYMASTSKQFTAACACIARHEGLFDFNQSIAKWIPELPDWAQPVRIDDLLHHTSGLRDYESVDALQGGKVQDWAKFDVKALLAQLQCQRRLGLEPGRRYDYCNTNYVLMAEIIARAADEPFAEFSNERLFAPLGMSSSGFIASGVPRARAARAYTFESENWREDDEPLGVLGDGGLCSTVDDQLIWLKSIMDDALGIELLEQLGESVILTHGVRSAYGRGLLYGIYRGAAFVAHGGNKDGWASHNVIFPDHRLGVSVIACFRDAPVGDIARAAAAQILDLSPDLQRQRRLIPQQLYGGWVDPLDGFHVRIDPLEGSGDDSQARLSGDHEGVLIATDSDLVPLCEDDPYQFHLLSDDVLERRWYGGHDRLFERAPPWTPKNLDDYAGTFCSDELDIVLVLRVEDGDLIVMREGDPFSFRAQREGRLYPISDERFGGIVALRFHREGDRVSGFDLDAFRARNFRFEPQPNS